MKRKIDKKIFLLVAGAALLAGGLIWLALVQQFGKIREVSDNIQKEQLDSMVQEQRSQRILEMGKELGDVGKNQQEMKALLVEKENAVPFLKTLETIAGATGNSIKISVSDLTKMKTQAPKKTVVQESDNQTTKDIQKEDQAQKTNQAKTSAPDFSNQLGFSIELTGEYGSMVDFLTKLQNLPYLVKVYNFQIAPLVAKGQTAPVSENQPADENGQSQSLKSTLIIGVYTNGAK